jgi:hypothetical protein
VREQVCNVETRRAILYVSLGTPCILVPRQKRTLQAAAIDRAASSKKSRGLSARVPSHVGVANGGPSYRGHTEGGLDACLRSSSNSTMMYLHLLSFVAASCHLAAAQSTQSAQQYVAALTDALRKA